MVIAAAAAAGAGSGGGGSHSMHLFCYFWGGAKFEVCVFKGRRNVGLRDDDFWGLGFGMLARW